MGYIVYNYVVLRPKIAGKFVSENIITYIINNGRLHRLLMVQLISSRCEHSFVSDHIRL